MDLKRRLESHGVSTLKKEISKTNIKGYSKMKKPEIINLMLKNSDRFNHIQHKEKAQRKEPEPKKAVPKLKNSLTLSNGESISLTKIMNMVLSLEQLNKNYKIFLQDFKKGKTKFGRKIPLKEYKEELDKLKKQLNETDKVSRKASTISDKTLKEEYTPQFKREVNNLISERNKIARLYNRYIRRYNGLDYLTDYESK